MPSPETGGDGRAGEAVFCAVSESQSEGIEALEELTRFASSAVIC